jgi:hypothetical protein
MKRIGNKKIYSNRITNFDFLSRATEKKEPEIFIYSNQPVAVVRALRTPELTNPTASRAFQDFYFEVTTPFAIQNNPIDDTLRNISMASKFELNSNFNFFNKEYDSFKVSHDESDFLNYYLLISRDITNNQKIEDIVSLNGTLDDSLLNNQEGAQEYFSKYASLYDANPISNTDKTKLSKIVVDTKYSHVDTSGKKDLFTNYIQMDLHKDSSGDFIESIGQTKFDNKYMSKVSDFSTNSINPNLNFSVLTQEITNINLDEPTIKETEVTETIGYFDYVNWLTSSIQVTNNPSYFDFSGNDAFFIGSPASFDDSQSNNQFYVSLMSNLLYQKAKNLSKKHLRSVKDIQAGKKCYSEITAVKIEKKLESPTGTYIQSYYFENDSKELLTFIDTQVKKENQYVYKLFYYVLVVGNEITVEATTLGQLEYTNSPKVYVFEIETTANELNNKIIPASDAAPISPIVTPIPFKDIKNKIRFNFQQSVDKYEEYPIIIQDSDSALFDKIRISQKKETDSKILFETIDTEGFNFEIFRTIDAPDSYEDFKNKLLTTISNTSYVDSLEINRKYYYIFRSKNQAGFISNPSPVYEIQLLENSGTHYPIIRLYKFPEVQQVTVIKNFKNKLYLSAAYNQLAANEVGQTATGSPSLGIGEPIWNKEYKVRLTSRQTGRKIDINFKFTYGLRQE